jgi:hypothetical protein
MSISAVIVYGFNEGNPETCLDEYWLSENFPNVHIYSTNEDIKNHEKMYGIECDIDENTGIVSIAPEKKEEIQQLYEKFEKHHEGNLDKNVSVLGYHLALEYDDVEMLLNNRNIMLYELDEYNFIDHDGDSDDESDSSTCWY